MRKISLLFLLSLLILIVACGGSSTPSNAGGGNAVPVTLNVTTASSLVGQSTQFSANVPVNWTVKEGNGGTITTGGLYTAPNSVGAFHIVATSKADATQTATAAVDVTAKFLSLQKNLAGTAQPYSVTPVLNILNSDGKTYMSTPLNDPSTNAPFDTNAFDIMISPDGTKAVATISTQGTYGDGLDWFYDLVVATADGSSLTQITHNNTTSTDNVADLMAQWSPDGKTIVDTHVSTDPNSQRMPRLHIATMNPDGSDLRLLFPVAQDYAGAEFPTFSPDGKRIAAEVWQGFSDGTWADGIAIMNADGTNVKQLTGFQSETSYINCLDYMPTFTADGTKIVYTHECWPDLNVITSQLYSVNVDGSSVTRVYGSDVGNVIACQPRTFTDGTIAFSSNHDGTPGTDAFDMYVVKLDGTGLTRITNNTLYDGFSIWWMHFNETTASARAYQKHSPLQMRLDHRKMLQQRRAR